MEEEQPPTKAVSSETTLQLHSQVRFYDFEGRSELEAMAEIVKRVKPRNLIIIHGSESDTEVRKLRRQAVCFVQRRLPASSRVTKGSSL